MRTFIAIDLSKEIKDFLNYIQEQLKRSGADVKWVEPCNIHLTLKFLGEIDEKKLVKVESILQELTREKRPFYISISGLGAFPNLNFLRVIWVGVNKGDKEAKEIAQELEEKIAKIGIPKEKRPFSSHITIGRIRSSLNRQSLVEELNNLANKFEKVSREFLVEKITLFKSNLTPKGPIYEILQEANLTKY